MWKNEFVKVQLSWDIILKPITTASLLGSSPPGIQSGHPLSSGSLPTWHSTHPHRSEGAHQLPAPDSCQPPVELLVSSPSWAFLSSIFATKPGMSGFQMFSKWVLPIHYDLLTCLFMELHFTATPGKLIRKNLIYSSITYGLMYASRTLLFTDGGCMLLVL